jgi:hypothetical protein
MQPQITGASLLHSLNITGIDTVIFQPYQLFHCDVVIANCIQFLNERRANPMYPSSGGNRSMDRKN